MGESTTIVVRARYELYHSDQMARFFVQYSAIFNNEHVPQSVQKFAQN